jgi:hypothetical protein
MEVYRGEGVTKSPANMPSSLKPDLELSVPVEQSAFKLADRKLVAEAAHFDRFVRVRIPVHQE